MHRDSNTNNRLQTICITFHTYSTLTFELHYIYIQYYVAYISVSSGACIQHGCSSGGNRGETHSHHHFPCPPILLSCSAPLLHDDFPGYQTTPQTINLLRYPHTRTAVNISIHSMCADFLPDNCLLLLRVNVNATCGTYYLLDVAHRIFHQRMLHRPWCLFFIPKCKSYLLL